MFTKTLGSFVAFGICAVATLSSFDAEAGCCHRHRRAACCDPCPTTCCDPCGGTVISYAAPVARPCCASVVEEVVVSGCCLASAPAAVPMIAAAAPAPSAGRIAAVPVSVVRSTR